MGSFGRAAWEPVFESGDEAEAGIVAGLLQGHGIEVKVMGDPSEPYSPLPAIRGMAGRYGRFIVYAMGADRDRAENIIKDYMEEREEESQT